MKNLLVLSFFFSIIYSASAQVPTISTISPGKSWVGQEITITGSNFGSLPSENLVCFGTVNATITSASSTQVKVIVPPGISSVCPINITNTTTQLTVSSVASPVTSKLFTLKDPLNGTYSPTYSSSNIPVLAYPKDMCTGDMNKDGNMDLIIANDSVVIKFGNGTGTFPQQEKFYQNNTTGCAVADFNSDGKTDLAVITGNLFKKVFIYIRNASNNGFLTPESHTLTYGCSDISTGDYNNDGRIDIAITNFDRVSVLTRNPSNTAFIAPVDYVIVGSLSGIVSGDFNNDGYCDIAASYLYGSVKVMIKQTSGSGFDIFSYNAGNFIMDVCAGDFNGDGKLDLATANNGSQNLSVLFRNDTNNGYDAAISLTAGTDPTNLMASDMDGDGVTDLGVANFGSGNISIILKSSGGFQSAMNLATAGGPQAIADADFNKDGYPDLAVANNSGNSISILLKTPNPPSTTITIPNISSLTPGIAKKGDTITVKGKNFGSSANDVNLFFGPAKASIEFFNDSIVKAVVPGNVPSYCQVTLNYKPDSLLAQSNIATPEGINIVFEEGLINHLSYVEKRFLTGNSPNGITVTDFDGDNMPDIATTNENTKTISILKNAGKRDFIAKQDISTAYYLHKIHAADFNGDGKSDLAVTAPLNNKVLVLYRNTSNSGYDSPVELTTGSEPEGINAGDLNSDGRIDIVVVNIASNNVTIFYRNAANSGFEVPVHLNVASQPRDIAIADFNGDRKPDIAASCYVSNSVSVLYRKSDNTGFESAISYSAGMSPMAIVSADINKDGKIDMALAGDQQVAILYRTASGFQSPVSINISPLHPQDLSAGDFNGDGLIDLVVANTNENSISLLIHNSSSHNLELIKTYPSGVNPYFLVTNDMDNDGKDDIISSNNGSNNTSVYYYTDQPPVINSFSPSSGVVGIEVTIVGQYFNKIKNQNTVYFNGIKATINSATSTQLKVLVPQGAVSPSIIRVVVTDYGLSTSSLSAVPSKYFNITYAGTDPEPLSYGRIDYSALGSPTSIITADYNNDNLSDIAASDNSLFINSGTSFLPRQPYGNGSFHISFDEFNGDGRPDILMAINSGSIGVRLRNETNDGFISGGVLATGTDPIASATGDFNRDGRTDVAIANPFAQNISVILRDIPNSGFKPPVNYLANNYPYGITTSDFNGDTYLDLAVCNLHSNNISVLYGNGDGTFSNAVQILINESGRFIISGDFNGDSKIDIATANNSTNSISILYRNTSNTGFDPVVRYVTGSDPQGISATDFNGDNLVDLVTSNSEADSVTIFLRTSNNSGFVKGPSYKTGDRPFSVAIADFNGDNFPDIVTANYNSNNITVLTHRIIVPAIEPTIPSSSLAISDTTQDSMTLVWTNGNGSKRIIIARAISNVDQEPQDEVIYNSNSTFYLGQDIGGGNIVVYNGTGNTATVSGLNDNTLYSYKIFEYNETTTNINYLVSSYAFINVSTLPYPPYIPSNFTTTPISSSQINISWTDNSVNETGFLIERSLSTGAGFIIIDTVSANATSYSDFNLLPNTTYYYRISAINSGGNSTYTSESSATTPIGTNLHKKTLISSINISPNPSLGNFEINLSSYEEIENILLFNNVGDQIQVENYVQIGNSLKIKLNDIKPGIYTIYISSDERVFLGKIFIIN